MKAFFRQNSYYFITILFLVLSGGIILLTMIDKGNVTIWINKHHHTFLDYLFRGVNLLGTLAFSIFVIVATGIFKNWRTALNAAICFAATGLIVQFLKYVIFPGELRPVLYLDGIYPLRLIEGVIQLETESFPSGHTAAAFSVATFLALLLSKKQWHWILALIAASVGYARMYLSQHFITDVYAGMIIGVITTTFIYHFILYKKQK